MDETDRIEYPYAGEGSADPALDSLLADLLTQWDEAEVVVEEESDVGAIDEPEPDAEQPLLEVEGVEPLVAAELLQESPAEDLFEATQGDGEAESETDGFDDAPPIEAILAALGAVQQETEPQYNEAPETALAGPPVPEAEPEGETTSEPESVFASRVEPKGRRHREPGSLLEMVRKMYQRVEERQRASAGGAETREGYVLFRLGMNHYGIPVRNVLEADRLPKMTPVPFVPEFVRGVANLRGQIIPLIDLRVLGGTGLSSNEGRMLVVRAREDSNPSALVVDGLNGIAWLESGDVRSVNGSGDTGPMRRWTAGAVEHRDRMLGIVDLDRIFASPELAELRNG